MATSFDPRAPGAIALLVLLAFRIGGVLLVAPVFSARNVPPMLRAALLVLLTLLLAPVAAADAGVPEITVEALFAETLAGFAIGFGAAVVIGAMELAADVLSIQTGLSAASAMDPVSGSGSTALGQLMNLFGITLFLAVGGHLLMLEALSASVHALPVGSAMTLETGLRGMVSLGAELFALGVRFAAPVLAAIMIANLAMGILGKAAPQFNVLIVAFPVQTGLGLLTLGLAIPVMATFFTTWASWYGAVVERLVEALGGGR